MGISDPWHGPPEPPTIDDILDDPLLDEDDPGTPDPKARTGESALTPDAVTKLKKQMVSRDEDPALARPAPIIPSDLVELAFEVYDRKANMHRIISRAFTFSQRLVLLKVVLDALAGAQSPVSARELMDYRSGRAAAPEATLAAFTCPYGTTHRPDHGFFLKRLIRCRDENNGDAYNAYDRWYEAHRPWTALSMEFASNGHGTWQLFIPAGVELPDQLY